MRLQHQRIRRARPIYLWHHGPRSIPYSPLLELRYVGLPAIPPLEREPTSRSFRAEAFNLFNTLIYGEPGSDLSNPSYFGKVAYAANAARTDYNLARRSYSEGECPLHHRHFAGSLFKNSGWRGFFVR